MELDRRGRKTFSPDQWLWFLRVGMVLVAPACILVGLLVTPRNLGLVWLGLGAEVLLVLLHGYWNQVRANREPVETRRSSRFSPRTWIGMWIAAVAILGPGAAVLGLQMRPREYRLVLLGPVLLALCMFMVGFWRRVDQGDVGTEGQPGASS